jgi:hypothetical protein
MPRRKRLAAISFKRCIDLARMYPPGFAVYIALGFLHIILKVKADSKVNSNTQISKFPLWLLCATLLGLAWNVFGVVQFLATTNGTVGSMMSQGLTKEQADLYLNLPLWMNAAFAIGVFGGVLGSLALLLRKRAAIAIFWLSLVAYIVLYIGDITQGVFAAFGIKQVVAPEKPLEPA